VHDQRWKDLRTAVRKVDIKKNEDEEDLYLLFSAADAAGDKENAAAVRHCIEQLPLS
jgi:polyphosphate kinase 2 (PPK2 family)